MNTSGNYNILVVDGDAERRMRLKAASSAASIFKDVQLCKDFRSAIQKLTDGIERVIIFIGLIDSSMTVTEFVEKCREFKGATDSAFIQILDQRTGGKSTTIASSVLAGVDSVLQEPFSVDALTEVTSLAAAVYGQRRRGREEKAIVQLVKSMLQQLDKVATGKRTLQGSGDGFRELREVGKALRNLNSGMIPFYISTLIEQSESSQVPYEVVMFLEKQARELSGIDQRQNRASPTKTENVRIIRKR